MEEHTVLRADCQNQTNPLIRFLFRFSTTCILLLAVILLLGHRQIDHASDLRTLLLPLSCSAPCFLGITPGLTTLKEGLDHLRASPLVQSVSPVASETGSPIPSSQYDVEFVRTLVPVRAARVKFLAEAQTDMIEDILLMNTDIQLRDLELTFGQPTQFVLDDRFHLGFVTYVAYYPQYQMYVEVVLSVCTFSPETIWNGRQSLNIGIASAPNYSKQNSYYPADAHQTNGGWLQKLHELKQTDCA